MGRYPSDVIALVVLWRLRYKLALRDLPEMFPVPLSRTGRIACESKAGLAALSVDHLAGNHLKVTLVLAVPAADIAAIKTDHDGFGRLCHRLCHFRGVRLHYRLAGPHR